MTSRKGFTVVELLVVVVLIVLLAAVLMPLFIEYRSKARQQQCQANFHTIAEKFHLYHNDYLCQLPIIWGQGVRSDAQFGMGLYNSPGANMITRWTNPAFNNYQEVVGRYQKKKPGWISPTIPNWNQEPTVGGCLYLLIKYEDSIPEHFLCPSDKQAQSWDWQQAIPVCQANNWPVPQNWDDLNDFQSMANLSYAYNDPWKNPLDDSASSAIVLLADRNHAYETLTGHLNQQTGPMPVVVNNDWTGRFGMIHRAGNSPNHRFSGQNVLFADLHVRWCPTPLVGIQDDNIYTHWDIPDRDKSDKRIGFWNQGHAQDFSDSYLGN